LSLSNIPVSYNGYLFHCVVTNPCGTGATSTNASLTVNANILTATAATNITSVSFFANWNAVPGASSYYLDVSTFADFSSFLSGYNNFFVGNFTTYSVTGLTPLTTYYYRVRANNFCRNENSNTITVNTIIIIGDSYAGGKVAYIDGTGQHGLIAKSSNEPSDLPWGCSGTNLTGADGTAIGTGAQNTVDIVTECAEADIAARKCSDLVFNGYNDWYLPSKDELNQLYINKAAIGGFDSGDYWSSSETSSSDARWQDFGTGSFGSNGKGFYFRVRSVRSF